MFRIRFFSVCVIIALALAGAHAGDDKGFTPLFNGKDMTGLKENVFGKGKTPFSVEDGAIAVVGNPNGYFYTEKSYKNYVLRFDWKFLKDGNSGCLVHIQSTKGGGWPKCVEVQGLQRDHGNIFPLSAKGKFKIDKDAQKKAIKIGEWNTTEIVSNDGKLSSKINGIAIASGESELKEGPIGWQSEGAPLLFKNIRIKVLE
ncbi:MAG: DUF1080 domain-containing protein [Gemmataceae bacterium]